MRGFWIDERFEWSIWTNKNIFNFKILKQIKKLLNLQLKSLFCQKMQKKF